MVQHRIHGDLGTIGTSCTTVLASAGLIPLLGFAPGATLDSDFCSCTCQRF